jgi:hypothetical protein
VVEIKSYLKDSDGEFVDIATGGTAPPDPDYVDGAIHLTIDGREIVGLDEWDYVDQLWCYLADMAVQFRATGHADTYFPDQPIKLSFDGDDTTTLVTYEAADEVKRARVSTTELFNAIKTSGLSFFEKMSELVPATSYTEARRQLSSL